MIFCWIYSHNRTIKQTIQLLYSNFLTYCWAMFWKPSHQQILSLKSRIPNSFRTSVMLQYWHSSLYVFDLSPLCQVCSVNRAKCGVVLLKSKHVTMGINSPFLLSCRSYRTAFKSTVTGPNYLNAFAFLRCNFDSVKSFTVIVCSFRLLIFFTTYVVTRYKRGQ